MEIFLSSFALVALSEMGDKTQLLAFSLAARFKNPIPILLGILSATVINHTLAAVFGTWISLHIPTKIIEVILIFVFIGFGFWMLKPDTLSERKSTQKFGPFLTTAFLFFVAEMGDKTQLATIALGARYQAPLLIILGTTLGMLVSDGIAIFLGELLVKRISMKWIRRSAAGLFFIFGILSAVKALT